MKTPLFSRIAIVGIGLIGSSIARAAKNARCCETITIIDHNPDHLNRAIQLQLGHHYSDNLRAVEEVELVILATPTGTYANIVRAMVPYLSKGCILSDTGSVKQQVIDDLVPLLPDTVQLIPAHPVAGTEYSGPDAGFASLFKNRFCLITPPEHSLKESVNLVQKFWQSLGAIVELMDPTHHDRVLAMTSHLPHFISFALVRTAANLEDQLHNEQVDDLILKNEVMKYSAGGFRDLTRIAHADPDMWRDVFLYNRDAILEMLHRFQQDLSALAAFTARGDGEKIENWVKDSRRIRKDIQKLGQAGAMLYNEQALDNELNHNAQNASKQNGNKKLP